MNKTPARDSQTLRLALSVRICNDNQERVVGVLFDGANGVPVNSRTRTQDQERAPMTREEWPCIFANGDMPAFIISTLETLAVLVALMLFQVAPSQNIAPASRSCLLGLSTVSRSHGARGFHEEGHDQGAGGVVAQVGQLRGRRSRQWELERHQTEEVFLSFAGPPDRDRWTTRRRTRKLLIETGLDQGTGEVVAQDALAHGNVRGSDPKLRCLVDPAKMDWVLLPRALEVGQAANRR